VKYWVVTVDIIPFTSVRGLDGSYRKLLVYPNDKPDPTLLTIMDDALRARRDMSDEILSYSIELSDNEGDDTEAPF